MLNLQWLSTVESLVLINTEHVSVLYEMELDKELNEENRKYVFLCLYNAAFFHEHIK